MKKKTIARKGIGWGVFMRTRRETRAYEIVESQVLFLDSPESELFIHLVVEKEFVGDIRIRFITDDTENLAVKGEMQEDALVLTCINFDNELGSGTNNPVNIGTSKGKRLMLHIWAYLMGDKKARKIEYTIFRER